jgi:DNA-binding NarL/FixJ family response regulator
MDLGKAGATRLVQRCAAHFFEQLFDHGPDAHDLGRLLDQVGGVADLVVLAGSFRNPHPVLGDHDDLPQLVVVSWVRLLVLGWVHVSYPAPSPPLGATRSLLAMVPMHGDVIRVVVVDDHALHRDGTRQILEVHSDLQVVGEAASGEVALALVNQLRPDVVLMDIRLPGMNGIEVTRQLIQDHPDVRVLMVSAYDEDEYVRGALEAGAVGYLSKTAPGKELVQAVRAVAGGTTVLQSGLTARLLIAARQPEQGVTDLSERELTVLRLLAEGLHNREIGEQMGISTRTVDRHCDNIYAKLGVSSRTEAVVRAISTKLLTVSDEL